MIAEADKQTLLDLFTGSAGIGVLLIQLSVITGLLPALLLALVAVVILTVPALLLGLAVAVVSLPPYGAWLLVARYRRRRHAIKATRALGGPRAAS